MIAKLRSGLLGALQMFDHLSGDIVLEFAILDAAGVADDMKDNFARLLGIRCDVREMVGKSVVVGRQSQRPRQGLKTGVSMSDGVQRAHARMGL